MTSSSAKQTLLAAFDLTDSSLLTFTDSSDWMADLRYAMPPSEDENTDPKLSFIISRKPLVDMTNKAENAVTEHEDINTEEDTQKEQLNE